MRRLLSDIVGSCVVGQVPVAREDFAEDRVKRLLDSAMLLVSLGVRRLCDGGRGARRTDVPAAQVEFHDGNESFSRVLDLGDG